MKLNENKEIELVRLREKCKELVQSNKNLAMMLIKEKYNKKPKLQEKKVKRTFNFSLIAV